MGSCVVAHRGTGIAHVCLPYEFGMGSWVFKQQDTFCICWLIQFVYGSSSMKNGRRLTTCDCKRSASAGNRTRFAC
ncbi:hypothetical protein PROFUN_12082 [Planoprotostelium fungivorum]|uniref:Uncharacterized protein n=1 Tax=Planoprotostelium fungivorum TaxID=1890364 RepID=A0A2P6N8R5_9EUKA|nr:hypothetical protein PROFUN_12082 [Planoprotostelium fungivorum]